MAKIKRLVYLPDPTIKFYDPIHRPFELHPDGEIFSPSELAVYDREEVEELIVINKTNFKKKLKQKFIYAINCFSKGSYFAECFCRLELFEIIEEQDAKTPGVSSRSNT